MHWLFPLAAFLVGSIPFGLFAGKIRGVDIREHGSGNIGATNVFRTLGKGPGIACLLLDTLKGLVPVLLAINLVRVDAAVAIPIAPLMNLAPPLPEDHRLTTQIVAVATAMAAILGHNFSPWLGFKGGKGIATSAGVLIGLMPVGVLVLVAIWIVTTLVTRYVSVGSVVAAVALPLVALYGSWRHDKFADGTWNKPLFVFALVAAALAVWKHRSNLKRLLSGSENRIFRGKK
ncbi:MAG: glycerol-3-phosphate 1-O-acyltransferase PlsY, partial [Akkermansiaceae bacterium]|nr:glycerol-3-phosphate 1-O-acyltransferase PlsY [Akkermansiaceae bacterium]